ncbi:MAG: hypothetical protein HC834_00935 [Rhodospirillales bacterium]|nr:hypothetical protein [Rhodospirillales bacterium]
MPAHVHAYALFARAASQFLLRSIQETGADGTTLPETTFNYSTSTPGWASNYTFKPPVPLASGSYGNGTGFVDLDGDGYPDLVRAVEWPGTITFTSQAWLNRPTGWVLEPDFALPLPNARYEGKDHGGRFVDLNGDGRVDFVYGFKKGSSTVIASYLNTGLGWQRSPQWDLPTYITRWGADDDDMRTRSLIDINGDGRVDFLYRNGTGETIEDVGAWLNTGSGWAASEAYKPKLVQSWDKSAIFVDVNGDGLPDQVSNQNGGYSQYGVVLNTGSGWNVLPSGSTQYNAYMPPRLMSRYETPSLSDNYLEFYAVEVTDVNGDGLSDLVYGEEKTTPGRATYLNTGKGWLYSSRYTLATYLGKNGANYGAALLDLNADGLVDLCRREGLPGNENTAVYHNNGTSFSSVAAAYNVPFRLDRSKGSEYRRSGSEIVDLNADGVPDQVWSRYADGSSEASGASFNTARPHNLLTSVTNGFGVSATITYAPLTARDSLGKLRIFTPADDPLTATANDVSRVIGPMLVVDKVSHEDGAGGSYLALYTYGGLRAHRIYGSLGFERTSVTDSRTNIVSTTVYSQTYPFVGMPVQSTTKSAGGGAGSVTLSESNTTYDVKYFNSGKTRMVFATTSSSTSRDLDGSVTAQSTTTTQREGFEAFDAYGNSLYLKVDTGEGYSKETVNTYTNTVDASPGFLTPCA